MALAKIKAFVIDFTNKLLQAGNDPTLKSWDNEKTYHTNLLLILSSIGVFIFIAFNIGTGQRLFISCGSSIIGFNLLLFYLQTHQQQHIARILIVIGYPILFFTLTLFGQGSIEGAYAFFLMALLAVLFFRSAWHQLAITGYVLVLYVASQIILLYEYGTITSWTTILNNTILFASITSCIIFITNSFIRQSIKSNKKNTQRLSELVHSNEELKRLNYMVSHDLRTPLRHIISFAQIAQTTQQRGETSSTKEYITLIENSARELYHMTENLLSLAHLDRNQLRTEEVVLQDVFQKIKRQFAKVEDIFPISIHTEVEDYHHLNASPILLQMVLQNLVENGLKYNESSHKKIWLRVAENNTETIITVEDNGIGIPVDDRKAIFTVFHRLNKHKYQGTGLGLAIAKKIMDIHQGKIEVDAGANGSLFTLHFPKNQSSGESPEDNKQEEKAISIEPPFYPITQKGRRAIF